MLGSGLTNWWDRWRKRGSTAFSLETELRNAHAKGGLHRHSPALQAWMQGHGWMPDGHGGSASLDAESVTTWYVAYRIQEAARRRTQRRERLMLTALRRRTRVWIRIAASSSSRSAAVRSLLGFRLLERRP